MIAFDLTTVGVIVTTEDFVVAFVEVSPPTAVVVVTVTFVLLIFVTEVSAVDS